MTPHVAKVLDDAIAALRAERDRLREALAAIAEFPDSCAIASAALAVAEQTPGSQVRSAASIGDGQVATPGSPPIHPPAPPCPFCDGRGGFALLPPTEWIKCRMCHGSGRVARAQHSPGSPESGGSVGRKADASSRPKDSPTISVTAAAVTPSAPLTREMAMEEVMRLRNEWSVPDPRTRLALTADEMVSVVLAVIEGGKT